MLKVGDKAPDFLLKSGNGSKFALSQFRGRNVVLYFYPKDNTPGCTKEACGFRDAYKVLGRKAIVLGVSPDDEESHRKFSETYELPFPLLSDADAKVSKAYGVCAQKNGKGIRRTTFIIDKTGKIKHIFGRVNVDNHAEEVTEVL